MITTITTVTTVTTVTTTTVIAAMGLTAAIGILAVGGLIAFLATKELAGVMGSVHALRMAKFINVGLLPLIIVFAGIFLVTIIEVLITY